LGCASFESRLGRCLSWLRFFMFFLNPLSKCQDSTLIRPCPLLNNFQLISHPIIWCCIVSILTTLSNNPLKQEHKLWLELKVCGNGTLIHLLAFWTLSIV
jgi:hypothetical protein